MPRILFWLAVFQGTYYALTGLWPLVSMRSFLAVTGPKRDLWLVRTVGLLVLVIGASLLMAAMRTGKFGPETTLLAVGSAVALAGIDIWYVARGTIAPIYLLDAGAEIVLIAAWAVGWAAG